MFKKRLVSLAVTSMVVVMAFGSAIVLADDSNPAGAKKPSVGSVATDFDPAATPITGQDEAQNAESTSEIADEASEECDVYATLPSSYTVRIPKKVVLEGTAGGSGTYKVTVSGDIAGNETIVVKPDVNAVDMEQTGKDSVPATITQTKTEWTVEDNGLASGVSTTGTITASGLTAGSWKGTFNFDISLK